MQRTVTASCLSRSPCSLDSSASFSLERRGGGSISLVIYVYLQLLPHPPTSYWIIGHVTGEVGPRGVRAEPDRAQELLPRSPSETRSGSAAADQNRAGRGLPEEKENHPRKPDWKAQLESIIVLVFGRLLLCMTHCPLNDKR